MKTIILISFFCQSIVLAENLGDYFHSKKNYFDAITEYRRILFFKDYDNKDDILYKMGRTYYDWGKLREAEDMLLHITGTFRIADLNREGMILLSKIHWDSYHYEAMRAVLDQLSLDLNNESKLQVEYIRAWTYIYQAQWEIGMEILRGLDDGQYNALVEDLNHVYELPQKSVFLAGMLSKILPGAGQLYSGDYNNALYSFLLVGSISASMIWDIYQKAYFTSFVKYLFLYTRYSKGSIYKMKSAIVRKNVNRTGDFLKSLSDKYPKPIEILEKFSTQDYP